MTRLRDAILSMPLNMAEPAAMAVIAAAMTTPELLQPAVIDSAMVINTKDTVKAIYTLAGASVEVLLTYGEDSFRVIVAGPGVTYEQYLRASTMEPLLQALSKELRKFET